MLVWGAFLDSVLWDAQPNHLSVTEQLTLKTENIIFLDKSSNQGKLLNAVLWD